MASSYWTAKVPAGRTEGMEDQVLRGVPTPVAMNRTSGKWRGDEQHVLVVTVADGRDAAIERFREAGVGGYLAGVSKVGAREASEVAEGVLSLSGCRGLRGDQGRRTLIRCEALAAEVVGSVRDLLKADAGI